MLNVAVLNRRRSCGVSALPFVLTAATTTASETMTIPARNIGMFNATIDWGDGTTTTVIAYNDAGLSHVYAAAGTYTISVSGVFPNVYFYGDAVMAGKVQTVESLGGVGWISLASGFRGCVNLTAFTANGDTSTVTTIGAMFFGCSSLVTTDFTRFNTTSVTNMAYLFYNCVSLVTLDITGFVTSLVTTFDSFMRNTSALTSVDVSGFDTSSAEVMASMFRSTALTDVAVDGFDITSVTNLGAFMTGSKLPTTRYDATLIVWDALAVQPSLTVDFGNSVYTIGSAAETARSNLITTDLWAITDGGGI